VPELSIAPPAAGIGEAAAAGSGVAPAECAEAVGDRLYEDLFRLGALPRQPHPPQVWHERAGEIEADAARHVVASRARAAAARGRPWGPATLELESADKANEVASLRQMRAAGERAAASASWGQLDELWARSGPGHSVTEREAVLRALLPSTRRCSGVPEQAADQRFCARLDELHARVARCVSESQRVGEAASTAMRIARDRRKEAVASAKEASDGDDDGAREAAAAQRARADRLRSQMGAAVGRSQARLDESRQALRAAVREHLSRVLRLSPLDVERRGGGGEGARGGTSGGGRGRAASSSAAASSAAAAAPTAIPAPTYAAVAAAAVAGAPPSSPDARAAPHQLAPTPDADNHTMHRRRPASSSSPSSSAPPPDRASPSEPPFLDHALGASLAQFAVVFGKLHPSRESAAAAIVRWPEDDPAAAAAAHRRQSSVGMRIAGLFGRATPPKAPVLPARPACLYPPGRAPWRDDVFADGEALFEPRPAPESLGFALAVQDLRAFACFLARELEAWFPSLVPAVPPPRSELAPERAAALVDPARAAEYDLARAQASHEAHEWRSFAFECALDAASVQCYESLFKLCMDRWQPRDVEMMG